MERLNSTLHQNRLCTTSSASQALPYAVLFYAKILRITLNAIHAEYLHPSQSYRGVDEMPKLWVERMNTINALPEVIEFNVKDQDRIIGPRGYIKSSDFGYDIIREISLPLVSYISVMRLVDKSGLPVFYWKLFADFDAISDKRDALVFTYGKKGEKDAKYIKPPKKHLDKKRFAMLALDKVFIVKSCFQSVLSVR